jgi:hypothetical protein
MVVLEQRHLYLAHLLLMLVVAAALEAPQTEQLQVAAVQRPVALVQQTKAAVAAALVHQVLVVLAAQALLSSN